MQQITKYIILFFLLSAFAIFAQQPTTNQNKFRQLGYELPTPNVYRTASGAPGHEYWQQRADYSMNITLDEENNRIYGEETITYYNNSPDELSYLWLQLDQNIRQKDSDSKKTSTSSLGEQESAGSLNRLFYDFDGGFKIDWVKDAQQKQLPYYIKGTNMRIDLTEVLKPSKSVTFKVKWWYNINDRIKLGGRSGYEYFEDDNNSIYTIAQFFPRMCVYNDVDGWQHRQFLGRGEFTLTFGNYEVFLTVPADHLVAATGTLKNVKEILSPSHYQQYEYAKNSGEFTIIATQEEATEREKTKRTDTKTWHFAAENVRDFAFATSRKFIWDAMSVPLSDGRKVMAMSMYPKEANPLWEKFSTKAVAHTIKWYSHYTFDYPYPVAWSVHGDQIGMEYPMISFNFGKPEKDGTYSERTKYGMIGVIIHEVGHNYFPMIVNSDERQWTWMDEGLNTFLQYLTEQQWERDYPSRRGPAHKIVDYMKGDKSRISPIMTNSESIFQFGNNAYGKPATALNILRETVLGRELFDYAFKTYARRWMFKHPSPADFFRTMEDASGVDLDWFWRGWFYTTDHADQAITNVKWLQLNTENPEIENDFLQARIDAELKPVSSLRNETITQTQDEIDTTLRDFYTDYNPLQTTKLDKQEYQEYYNSLSQEEKDLLEANYNFYELTIENIGDLLMPVIIQFEFSDGSTHLAHLPAEIWRFDHKKITKVFPFAKEVVQITLDPFLEIADTDISNNFFPQKNQLNKFELFKRRQRRGMQGSENPMQRNQRLLELEKE